MDAQTLDKQLQTGKLNYDDFEVRFNELKQQQKELQEQLEYAIEIKKDEGRFKTLLQRVAGKNASILIDDLNRLGYALRKNGEKKEGADFTKKFESMIFRLLEQARAGKRSDVHYGIFRIFVSLKEEFPPKLIQAFKPYYSDEMFKVFIFSFLSGIIGKEYISEQ